VWPDNCLPVRWGQCAALGGPSGSPMRDAGGGNSAEDFADVFAAHMFAANDAWTLPSWLDQPDQIRMDIMQSVIQSVTALAVEEE
jgi:hypothetical protein